MEYDRRGISKVLQVLAWLVLSIGFIVGIVLGREEVEGWRSKEVIWHFNIMLTIWLSTFISAICFFAFSEIIYQLARNADINMEILENIQKDEDKGEL